MKSKKFCLMALIAAVALALSSCEYEETSETLYPPTWVKAEALSAESVKVSWASVSETFDYFYVAYDTINDADQCNFGESAGTKTSLIIENLEPSTKYYFFVNTVGYKGKSAWSYTASAKTKSN